MGMRREGEFTKHPLNHGETKAVNLKITYQNSWGLEKKIFLTTTKIGFSLTLLTFMPNLRHLGHICY